MGRPKYTIIISVDSLSSPDMELVSLLPNFREFISHASMCDNVTSVYPSLTYPAHATIVTGNYPINHGIINNTFFIPGKKIKKWYSKEEYIYGNTIIREYLKQGKKIASLLWPLTGKSGIQFNLPEAFSKSRFVPQFIEILKDGTTGYCLELFRKFGKIKRNIGEPEIDDFIQDSLLYTIKKYRPDLTLVHFLDLDKSRHKFGYAAPEAFRAMERVDHRIGELIKTLKSEGIYDETAVIILGDHSQIDVHTPIYLNERFEEDGYIRKKNEKITDWTLYAKPCDGSCYIYMSEEADQDLKDEIYEYLYRIQGEKKSGISKIYTGEEAAKFGATDKCSFMLEARIGYYFAENRGESIFKAAHGYLPTIPSYQTVFMAAGSGIKKNMQVSNISLVDEAPTIAKLLGINLGETNGRCIEEILDI